MHSNCSPLPPRCQQEDSNDNASTMSLSWLRLGRPFRIFAFKKQFAAPPRSPVWQEFIKRSHSATYWIKTCRRVFPFSKPNSTIVGKTTFKVYVGCGGAVCIVDEPKRDCVGDRDTLSSMGQRHLSHGRPGLCARGQHLPLQFGRVVPPAAAVLTLRERSIESRSIGRSGWPFSGRNRCSGSRGPMPDGS